MRGGLQCWLFNVAGKVVPRHPRLHWPRHAWDEQRCSINARDTHACSAGPFIAS